MLQGPWARRQGRAIGLPSVRGWCALYTQWLYNVPKARLMGAVRAAYSVRLVGEGTPVAAITAVVMEASMLRSLDESSAADRALADLGQQRNARCPPQQSPAALAWPPSMLHSAGHVV